MDRHPTFAIVRGSAWAWALLGGVWGAVCWALWPVWRTDPQYAFGPAVPLLVALAARRALGSADGRGGTRANAWMAGGMAVFAMGAAVVCGDPTWRFGGHLMAAGASAISGGLLMRAGGLRLLVRAIPVFALAWCAVPWPMALQRDVTGALLGWVTTVAAGVLTGVGVPVFQMGNALELGGGLIGVDEACSGIQSLQAAMMAAVFLGEMNRLTASRRAALVGVGIAVAMVANLARVLVLALISARGGATAVAQWHDVVGLCSSAGLFCILAAAGSVLARGGRAMAGYRARPGMPPVGVGWPILAVAVWLLCAVGGIRQDSADAWARWRIEIGELPSGWTAKPLVPSGTEAATLRYSARAGWRVRSPEGWYADVVHIRWDAGSATPDLAFEHTPANCLPWLGVTRLGEPVRRDRQIAGGAARFTEYEFDSGFERRRVLQAILDGEGSPVDGTHEESRRVDRLARVWDRKRRRVAEILLISVPSTAAPGVADDLADAVIRAVVRTPGVR